MKDFVYGVVFLLVAAAAGVYVGWVLHKPEPPPLCPVCIKLEPKAVETDNAKPLLDAQARYAADTAKLNATIQDLRSKMGKVVHVRDVQIVHDTPKQCVKYVQPCLSGDELDILHNAADTVNGVGK